MRREDKKKLILNRRIIVGHLKDLEGVLDYLISKQIFTPAIRERIVCNYKVPTDRIRQMLDELVQRNALSYQYFLESLILTDNKHIANVLEPDYITSEDCRLMIERERIILPQYPQQISDHQQQQHTEQFHSHLISNSSYPILHRQHFSNDLYSTPPLLNRVMRHSNSALPYHLQHYNARNNSQENNSSNSNFSSQTNSRSSSQSMSPTTNRVRSSSVNNFYPRRHNTRQHSSNGIGTSNSSGGLSNKSQLIDEDPNLEEMGPFSTAVTVSNCDENDQWSPLTNNSRPTTYNIGWLDVNGLELDFTVFKTLPNIRKQLREECYCMEKTPRGLCLLINNEHFYDANGIEMSILRRHGTTMDASRLKTLFEKLHFSVEMCVDMNEKDMRTKISQFANESNNNSDLYDSICLIILSHGTDGYVYGVDYENKINLDKDVLNLFDDVMIGKPKLFIFQACRGETLNQKENSFIMAGTSVFSAFNSNQSSFSPLQVLSNSNTNRIPKVSQIKTTDEETLNNRLSDLKVSCTQSNIQLKYKKNSASNSSTSSKSKMKTRSRSHSRGKYSSYLASAATAIKTAIKISPNTAKATAMLTSISTQTCSSISSEGASRSSSLMGTSTANCYPESIYTSTATNLLNFTDGRPIKTYMPSRSDFFIWYSSVRGFVSHRDPDGSPFIKCLVTVFSRCSYDLELIEMVRKVNSLMQQYEKKLFNEQNAVAQYFMVPVAEYHLTKRLHFNP